MKKYYSMNLIKHTTRSLWMRMGITGVLLFSVACLFAQENVVSGIVSDASTGMPLLGAQVEVVSKTASAITDADGAFSIKLTNPSEVLIVGAPGYATREIPLQGKTNVDIQLYSALFTSGYEAMESFSGVRRKTITTQAGNAVSDFSASTAFSIEPEIQSRLGGDVRVLNHTGIAGAGASLFIRGFNSLNASAQPLIVLDGVVWDNQLDAVSIHSGFISNPLANIDTRDIESVTVLKDGNSIYGSKAANGVILINTVRGKEMATKITANLWWGLNLRPNLPKMMDAGQYKTYASNQVEGAKQAYGITNQSETTLLSIFPFLNEDPNQSQYLTYHNNTDWQDEIYREGIVQNYSLGISGGDDVALYNISLGFANNEGSLKNTDIQRINARVNSDIHFTEKLLTKIDFAVSRTARDLREDGVNQVTSPSFTALIKAPLLSSHRYDISGNLSPRLSDYDRIDPMSRVSNPLSLVEVATGSSSRVTFSMRVNPQYEFNKNFQAGTIFNYRFHRVKESFFIPTEGVAPQQISEILTTFSNEVRDMAQRQTSVFSDTYLKGSLDLNKDNHLNLQGGFRYMIDNLDWVLPSGYDTGNDNIKVLVDGLAFKQVLGDNRKWKSMSWYVNADYDYQQKYFLSVTASMDASSRFGQETESGFQLANTSWAVFPSVSGAWLISSEDFMSNLKAINLLKLRASYGITGNDGIDEDANRSYLQSALYMNGALGLELAKIQNKAIQWETSNKLGVGLDIHFLDERVLLSADLFDSRTKNLLTQKSLRSITGLGYYWSNGGALKNSGYELGLNLKMVDTQSFKWELGGSLGHYKNEITELPDGNFYTEVLGGTVLTAVGQPAGVFYGYKTDGVFATTAEAANAGIYKLNNNGTLTPYGAGDVHFIVPEGNNGIVTNQRSNLYGGLEDARQIIGDPNPDFYGTINSSFRVKKLTLNAQFTYSYGNDVYNYLRSQLESGSNFYNQTTAMVNRWTAEGQVTNIPRAVYGDPMGNNVFSDRWIEDGSYLRLKTLMVSYDIPLQSIFIQGIRVWASANNLFTLSKYLGSDPEFSMNNSVLYQGIDAGLMPQSKSFFLGVKINL